MDAQAEAVDFSPPSSKESRYVHGAGSRSSLATSSPSINDVDEPRHLASHRAPLSASESEYESWDELHTPHGRAATDITPTATPLTRTPRMTPKPPRLHPAPPAPRGAVELKPYNHQVGGHTTVFRFSRRAVCKSLSNRENEFYETIERRHPELLTFLPRCVHCPLPPSSPSCRGSRS